MEQLNPQSLNDLRARVLRGEVVSNEELAAGVATLRAGRVSAMAAKATKEKKTGAAAVAELDDLLGNLGL